jgi:hypothetical protein
VFETLNKSTPAFSNVNAFPKVATEAVIVPDCILSVVVVAVVVIAALFNVALPYNLISGPSM